MPMTVTSIPAQERRKFSRNELQPPWAVNLLKAGHAVAADGMNFSEGGLCLRLQEVLEVRSMVRLQFTPARLVDSPRRPVAHSGSEERHFEEAPGLKGARGLQCTGRVTWVIQRLDLRDAPPFVYDVGIEFVDPPPTLRQFMAQSGGHSAQAKGQPVRFKALAPAVIRGREFIPSLERRASHQFHPASGPRSWPGGPPGGA